MAAAEPNPPRLSGGRVLAWYVALHALVFVVVPLLTQPNAPLDVVEMHWWGQHYQWGYHKHPPTPAWLVAGAIDCGAGLPGVYLLSQLCIAVCFGSCWALSRRWLSPNAALSATLLLETIYYLNYPTPELNHNVVLMATWAWTVVACWKAVETDRLRDWLLLGLAMGVGLLTKYAQGVLAVLLLGWLVLDPQARRCWRRPGPWLACGVSLLVFWPHLRWAAAHDWTTLRYFMDRTSEAAAAEPLPRWRYPVDFFVDQLLPLLPLLIPVAMLRIGEGAEPRRATPLACRYLAVVCAGPFVLLILLSAIAGFKLRNMWGAPLWTFAPLGLFVAASPRIDDAARQRVLITALCFLALAGGGLAIRNTAGPLLDGVGQRIHFNGPQLAQAAAEAWATVSDEPLPLVAGPEWLAGNVSLYLPHHPAVYAQLDARASPWADDDLVRREGAVLLWYRDVDGDGPPGRQRPGEAESWLRRFPTAVVQPEVVMHYRALGNLPPLRLGMAVVPPGG